VAVQTKEQPKKWMHTHSTKRWKCLNERYLIAMKLMATLLWDRKGVWWWNLCNKGHNNVRSLHETLKMLSRSIQNRRRGMLTYGVVLLHDNPCSHTATRSRAQLEHFTGSYLTTLLITLISLRATTTGLPAWRSGCDDRASAIMRSWWKVSKRGWAHRRQTSSTQAYKNLQPDTTSAAIPAVTTLGSSLNMYVRILAAP
jgi:hypothetical protein